MPALFSSVLADNPPAKQKLIELFRRFQQLENYVQRAVIARLLITVPSHWRKRERPPGRQTEIAVLETETLNEGAIFYIVIQNLLRRDHSVTCWPSRGYGFCEI